MKFEAEVVVVIEWSTHAGPQVSFFHLDRSLMLMNKQPAITSASQGIFFCRKLMSTLCEEGPLWTAIDTASEDTISINNVRVKQPGSHEGFRGEHYK